MTFPGHDTQHFTAHRRQDTGISQIGAGSLNGNFRLGYLGAVHTQLFLHHVKLRPGFLILTFYCRAAGIHLCLTLQFKKILV